MKIIKAAPTVQLLAILALFPVALLAQDLDLADVPLAVKTEGATPNIMLLMDDSGSMGFAHNGDDVFYAPGYDSDHQYKCSSGTVLDSVVGQTLTTFVSTTAGTLGTPFFNYNGSYYAWGNGASTAVTVPDPGVTITATSGSTRYIALGTGTLEVNRVCFEPDAEYAVLLKADAQVSLTQREQTGSNDFCSSGYTRGTGSYTDYCYKDSDRTWNNSCTSTSTTYHKFDSYCWKISSRKSFPMYSVPIYTNYATYTYLAPASTAGKVFTGNFLNWYFSATAAEFADNTLDGGYASYSGNYWTEASASNFATSSTNAAQRGLKTDVLFTHERIDVAVDVAKMLVRKMTGVNLALSSFHTQGDGTKVSDQNGYLMHGFVPLVADDETTATDNNKVSLIKTIDKLTADGGTPTAESMVRTARYFFTGWETYSFDYFDGAARTMMSKTLSDVLRLDKDTTDAVAYNSNRNVLSQGDWCQKNAMAVLTDGEPTGDDEYAGTYTTGSGKNKKTHDGPLWTYNAVGTSQEGNASYSGKTGIMRVPGALYDHDWVKEIRGTQNIESFFIAFGDQATVDAPIFDEAGKAGGGGANNSYAATDGSAVIDAFKQIVESVLAASTSITAVAVSSVAELQTENYAFQATYDTKFWTSEIKALNVNEKGLFVQPDGSGESRTSKGITPEWLASKVLSSLYILNDDDIDNVDVSADYRANGVKDRRVFTWTGTDGMRFGSSTMTRPSTASSSFSEFNALPVVMQNDIAVVAGNDSQERYDLMMYLMGDVANEEGYPSVTATNKYRQRGGYADADADGKIDAVLEGGLLGDIVDSSPVYVKQPSRNWGDVHYGTASARFSDFKLYQESRPAMVYAGGNDGMLHAFTVEAGTKNGISYPAGAELFAYMPSMLASAQKDQGFHYLSSRLYNHRFYVDLTTTPSDVFMDFYSTGTGADKIDAEWRTVLVGGLRKGGKGYYALDITCPYEDDTAYGETAITNTCVDESFGAENVLWEFDVADDADLGFTFSEPIIAKVNYDSGFNYSTNGDERNGNGNGRWAAIVGNGYNSASGRAALYILFLDGGLDGTWTEGVDYLKLYVSSSSVDKATDKNGLSSPTAIDTNFDGLMDRVYAGDLKGQMWSFDISAAENATNYAGSTLSWTANKLFTAGVDTSSVQSIITAPVVSRDATKGRVLPRTKPDLMVIFGTGRYLGEHDLSDTSVQSVYGVHDRGTYNLTRYDTVTVGGVEYPKLEPRIFKETTLGTLKNRTIEGDPLLAAQFGWYVDLASDLDDNDALSADELLGERLAFRPFLAGDLFVFNTILPIVGSCSGATQGWTMVLDWTSGVAYREETYDANSSGYIDPADQGYVGLFNEAAGSELGRGGSNIFDSVGDIARSQSFNFGGASLSERIGWEEKMPFGIKAAK